MAKNRIIRLTESDLHNMVMEAVNEWLKEPSPEQLKLLQMDKDCKNYDNLNRLPDVTKGNFSKHPALTAQEDDDDNILMNGVRHGVKGIKYGTLQSGNDAMDDYLKNESVRLSETEFHSLITESVKQALREMEGFDTYVGNYRDLGTASGLRSFSDVKRMYDQLGRYVNSGKSDWDFLHMEDWTKFVNRLRQIPTDMRFLSGDIEDPELSARVDDFVKKANMIPYPDLSVSSNSSFGDKTNDVRGVLNYAYQLYGGFIDYLQSTHEGGDMKQQDVANDWDKFDKVRNQNAIERKPGEDVMDFIQANNPFSHNKGNALKRYDRAMNKINGGE